MPNLLKVGFSTKDPELRAQELHTTGVPHPFIVEYDALVNDPRNVEQKTHVLLKKYHENKEWFRCDITTAIIAIRQAVNGTIILENNKKEFELEIQKKNKEKINQKKKVEEEIQSLFDLAYSYANGINKPKDEIQAVMYYRKAAEQGHTASQCNLGWMYAKGKGVLKDDTQAVFWYRKAALQGNAAAQFNLGWMYENGNGIYKDEKQAVTWYHKAALQGNTAAQFNLGWMYENGKGITKDITQATNWYQKSAKQGFKIAQNNLKRLQGIVTCPNCKAEVIPIYETRENWFIFFILSFLFVIPGLVYYLCCNGYKDVCPKCKYNINLYGSEGKK